MRPAATAIEADGLAEFVTLARRAQCGPAAERCREEARTAPPTPSAPPAHESVRTPPQRLFACLSRSALTSPSRWTAEPREHSAGEKHDLAMMTLCDSALSAAATEADGDSPIAPLGGSAARKVCSVVRHENILAEFHVDARLREVRRPRRQKLQSLMD
jgi:hypothetical protein